MPRAKSLSHYPARYGEIVEAAAVRNEQIDVPLASIEECRKLRGHYYAYKGALMRAAEMVAAASRAHPITRLSPGELELIERAKQSEMVIVTILEWPGEGGGPAPLVRFENRENSWQARALSGATSTAGTSKPTTGALDEIAARLSKIVPEGDSNGL